MSTRSVRRATALAASALLAVTVLAACADDAQSGGQVTLLTHDSFELPQSVYDAFRQQTGLTLKIIKQGDAGQLASTISLTPGSPKGDAVYGIDNTLASRPVKAGALESYTPPAAADGAAQYAIPGAADQLTAVDRGDVCLNVDDTWFANHHQQPPRSFRELTDPSYARQAVLLDPGTSSPGMAFLLTTIGVLGGGWENYWKAVKNGGATIAGDWEDAYNGQFTAGTEHGTKPIVVSYASSPAATAGTSALLDSCFGQVEYIGILKGTRNPGGARKLVDFMLSQTVQKELPGSMYVYPVQKDTPLPDGWQQSAPVPAWRVTLPPDYIMANMEKWQQQWRAAVGR